MLLASAALTRLGVDESTAPIRIAEGPKADGSFAGRRFLMLADRPAFELTYWCGTCPVTFERLEGATETLSIQELEATLAKGVDGIERPVVDAFAQLLPAGPYLPLLLRIAPRLVRPVLEDDYFAHEQVQTWGIDAFWGLPENPRTPYYRTFETAVSDAQHLYEFVVPMVPPSWNDRGRVAKFRDILAAGPRPTAVAVSTLDISQPAVDDQSADYYEHWSLAHFLLDGHHKLEAAATLGRELQLLAFVSVDGSLAPSEAVCHLPALRSQSQAARAAASA